MVNNRKVPNIRRMFYSKSLIILLLLVGNLFSVVGYAYAELFYRNEKGSERVDWEEENRQNESASYEARNVASVTNLAKGNVDSNLDNDASVPAYEFDYLDNGNAHSRKKFATKKERVMDLLDYEQKPESKAIWETESSPKKGGAFFSPKDRKMTKINRLYKIFSIALVVPATGKYSSIGQEVIDATDFTLSFLNNENIEIEIFDNKGSDANAKSIAKKINAGSFDVVIGPVFGSNTVALARELQRLNSNIKIISLSNDRSLEEGNVIVFGHSPDDDVNSMVSFFASRGVKNFVSLFPANLSGSRAFNVFKKSVATNDAKLMHVEFFIKDNKSKTFNNLDRIVKNLVTEEITNIKSKEVITLGKNEEFDEKKHSRKLFEADVFYISAYGEDLKNILSILMKKFQKRLIKHDTIIVFHSASESKSFEKILIPRNTYLFSSFVSKYSQFHDEFNTQYGYYPIKLSTILHDAILYSANLKQYRLLEYFFNTPAKVRNSKIRFRDRKISRFTGLNGALKLNDYNVTRSSKIMRMTQFGPRSAVGDEELERQLKARKFNAEKANNLDIDSTSNRSGSPVVFID